MARYKVDKDVCIGCGYCVSTAPQTFKFDENEKAEAYAENDDIESQEACDNCPVYAIERLE